MSKFFGLELIWNDAPCVKSLDALSPKEGWVNELALKVTPTTPEIEQDYVFAKSY